MIVGADCSVSTEPVAELAPHWNLVQVDNYIAIAIRIIIVNIAGVTGICVSPEISLNFTSSSQCEA